jgi:hypothetical protein
MRSPSTDPHRDRQMAYIQWGAAWFPKGIVNNTANSTQCHAALGMIPSTLAWVDQSPVSQRVVTTLQQGIPSTPVTASHVTQGRVEYDSNIL